MFKNNLIIIIIILLALLLIAIIIFIYNKRIETLGLNRLIYMHRILVWPAKKSLEM